MRNKILFAVILSAFCIKGVMAQNQIRLTQYMLQHSFVNPAAIGNDKRLNAAAFYRNQWTGMSGAPVTQGLAVNAPLKDGKNNLGLTVYHESIGIHKEVDLSAAYAYNIRLNPKAILALGLAATLDLKQSNFASANPENASDPLFQANSRTYAMPNFKFGAYYFTKKYYVGFAIPNLLENKIVYTTDFKGQTKFNGKNMHYYIQGGYRFSLSDNVDLGMSVLIKEVSGAPMQIDFNPQLIIQKKYGVGIAYRTSNELSFMANIEIKSMIKVGYAFDYALSSLKQYQNGGHEIMIIYRLAKNDVRNLPSF